MIAEKDDLGGAQCQSHLLRQCGVINPHKNGLPCALISVSGRSIVSFGPMLLWIVNNPSTSVILNASLW
jgi:hypothetical protein